MPFVFSPSNIMTYKTCPRKFWGTSLSKLIKYKPSKQKSRGMLIHEQIQDALRKPDKLAAVQEDTQVDIDYVRRCVADMEAACEDGYRLYIEHELCMGKDGARLDWWSDKAFLRAKADVFLLHPDVERPVLVVDIKTGRKYDNDHTQLRLEALLGHVVYQRPLVRYAYWYVDQGETEEALIDFRNGLAPVSDLYDTMQEIRTAIKNNDFPCKRNGLCRWCDFYQTENCDA